MNQRIHMDRLDHFVLTVKDVERTCRFYTEVLGMREVTFNGSRKALVFGRQKINLHAAGSCISPRAQHPQTGSADFCLITNSSIEDLMRHLEAQGVVVVKGPVQRTGAEGPILSAYLRDPDGNLVEVSTYDF